MQNLHLDWQNSIFYKHVLRLFSPVSMYDLCVSLKIGHVSLLFQFLTHDHLTDFPLGLSQPEDIINLHPQRLNSTSCEEVVDHPRARGDYKGPVCAESEPLPGVPLWRPSTDSVQGQCLQYLSLPDDWLLWGLIFLVVTLGPPPPPQLSCRCLDPERSTIWSLHMNGNGLQYKIITFNYMNYIVWCLS